MSRQALSYRILKILKLYLLRYQQRGEGFLIWEDSSNGVAGYQRRNLSHHSRKVRESESEVAQLCPTLCNTMDCSLSGSSVHGTFQARVLEWIAISFSRGSSRPRNWTQVSRMRADALPSEPPGKWEAKGSASLVIKWVGQGAPLGA